jgi:hypothetical protein
MTEEINKFFEEAKKQGLTPLTKISLLQKFARQPNKKCPKCKHYSTEPDFRTGTVELCTLGGSTIVINTTSDRECQYMKELDE